jgi:hypothetical protein
MIFGNPIFNAIYIVSFIICIIALPKCFAISTSNDLRFSKVKWKHLIGAAVISVVPLINVITLIIILIFWTTFIIKETSFMDTIHKLLNEDVF